MLFKMARKCLLTLATLFLKLTYVVQRMTLIFAMTCTNRDNSYTCVSDSAAIILICMLYLFCAYREVLFIFSVFPYLPRIENLIALGNIGIFVISTFVSFVWFQYKMDQLKRLINLFENLCQNQIITYNHIRICVSLIMFVHLIIDYQNVYGSGYKGPFLEKTILTFSMMAREFWLTSPLFQYFLWLYAFKMSFQRLTTYHVEMISEQRGCCVLGGEKSLCMIYNQRERVKQYFHVVRRMMNIKRLIDDVYGISIFLNIVGCFSIILFRIHTWSFAQLKHTPAVANVAINIFKVGFLFWIAESTSCSVRSLIFFVLFYNRLDILCLLLGMKFSILWE